MPLSAGLHLGPYEILAPLSSTVLQIFAHKQRAAGPSCALHDERIQNEMR
jgi:hypothetical protein